LLSDYLFKKKERRLEKVHFPMMKSKMKVSGAAVVPDGTKFMAIE
jgi:hypothetical protein